MVQRLQNAGFVEIKNDIVDEVSEEYNDELFGMLGKSENQTMRKENFYGVPCEIMIYAYYLKYNDYFCLLKTAPDMEKKKLEDLLVSVSENDDYAFRVFYDLYYRSVFRFTYYFLRNKEACGEVVSNVFVAVWKSRVSLRRISNIDAYLYVVARNESNRYLRECQARHHCLSLEEIPVSVLDLNSPPHDGEAPDSHLIESELEELICRLVNDLPERCRTVFLLNRQERLSSREIAEILSLSESTVRVQLKIAVDRIVAGVRKYYPDLKLIPLLLVLFSGRF